MIVSCITMRQIVYSAVHVPLSVNKSGIKSFSRLLSFPSASWLKNWEFQWGVAIYASSGGTSPIYETGAHWFSQGGAGGIPDAGAVGSCIRILHQSGWDALVTLHLHHVCGFRGVAMWQERQPSVWFSQTIAGCLSITPVTILSTANWAPWIFSSQTLVWHFMITNWYCSNAVREYPPLAVMAIFEARCMSDCSSCTQTPCLAIVADMLKTFWKLVAASKYEI